MEIRDREYSKERILPIGVGLIVAILSIIFPVSLPRVLNALAIIQATFLSIIVAIYILGSQIVLERYSPRVLEINPDSKINSLLILFGCSLLVDITSLLFSNYIIKNDVLVFVVIGSAFGLASGAFFALIQIKDEMIGSAQPDSVSEVVRESTTEDAFRDYINSDDDSRPFYDQFEVTRNALRNDDRQDARKVLEALTDSLRDISESVFSDSSLQAVPVTLGFLYIVDELDEIGGLAVDYEDKKLIDVTVKILRDIAVNAVEADFDRVSVQAVNAIHSISEKIIPNKLMEILVKSTWLSYGEILESAAEEDAMRTIGSTTNAISGLLMDIEEDTDIVDGMSEKVGEILIRALLDGWNSYIENYGDSVPVSEIGYGDPKYMTPDLLEYKHSFNHFEDNFQSCSRSMFRIRSSNLGKTRTIEMEQTIVQGLKQLAVTSAKIGNEGLCYHFTMVLVFIGLVVGEDSKIIATPSLIEEIMDTNETGRNAVDYVFAELRKFPDQNGPSPALYMGTEASELYDDIDNFANELMGLELKVYN